MSFLQPSSVKNGLDDSPSDKERPVALKERVQAGAKTAHGGLIRG